ncbi:hypothetical protein JCM9957A_06150 [Kineosporia succinea]
MSSTSAALVITHAVSPVSIRHPFKRKPPPVEGAVVGTIVKLSPTAQGDGDWQRLRTVPLALRKKLLCEGFLPTPPRFPCRNVWRELVSGRLPVLGISPFARPGTGADRDISGARHTLVTRARL